MSKKNFVRILKSSKMRVEQRQQIVSFTVAQELNLSWLEGIKLDRTPRKNKKRHTKDARARSYTHSDFYFYFSFSFLAEFKYIIAFISSLDIFIQG